jgi:acetate kinase
MNGADAVVFTGGIGENSAEVRARICDGLQWMALSLMKRLNRKHIRGRRRLITRKLSLRGLCDSDERGTADCP